MSDPSKALLAFVCVLAFHSGADPVRAAVFGCSKDNGRYSCDKTAFTKTLREAKTVAVKSQPFNEISTNALQRLARELGKSIQTGPAELIFELDPTDADGTVYYGPDDRELATLRVYTGGSNGAHEQLIWVESVVGQPDKPWAVVVHSAIQQFKANLK